MDYKKFTEVLQETISFYHERLLQDFDNYPEFEELSSQLSIGEVGKIRNYVSKLQPQGQGLDITNKPVEIKFAPPSFEKMDTINHQFIYLDPSSYDRYYFFDKKYFNDVDEYSKKAKRGLFYLCRNDLIKRLDKVFTTNLKGYKEVSRGESLKKISEDLFIGIDFTRSLAIVTDVENYTPPVLFLKYKGSRYLFSLDLNTFKFFLLNYNSFIAFFHYNKTLKKSTDEPVIYRLEDTGQLLYTNSFENLDRFNKFILFNAEIHIHYARLFEKWVIEAFAPIWLNDNTG